MRSWIVLPLLAACQGFGQSPLPLAFIPNAGQADAPIRFLVQTPELRAGFTSTGVVFQIQGRDLWVRFHGSNPTAAVSGERPQSGRANFFLGARGSFTDLNLYEQILYRGLYPGVDLAYAASGSRVKSEFRVSPGTDPHQIRLEYPESSLSVDPNGNLIVRKPGVEFREDAPVLYQTLGDGTRRSVEGSYEILDAHTVGFQVGDYDPRLALVIDPTISYSTYIGGSSLGAVTGVAVDASGNQYVTGWTQALDFPIAGAILASNRGSVDAFVAKLNPTGTNLIYATYIGGAGDDRAAGITVDASGQAYVAGSTASSNFPVVAAVSSSFGGIRDAFALKINALGNLLVYSTYLGGTNWDAATDVAVDSSGNAYITGDTYSANFPLQSAAQSTFGGTVDAFVTKLSSTGALTYSTFLGGSGDEHAASIAVHSSGSAYVAGWTLSTNFPNSNALQPATGGGQDAFVTKLGSTGTGFLYSTYLGGAAGSPGSSEQANGIAVDSAGNAYITGVTSSSNFPVTSGSLQTAYNGLQDGFVTKLNAGGTAYVYSTYLGGNSFDWASAIAVDTTGAAYIAGYTSTVGFPAVGGVQAGFNGGYDAFVTKLNPAGNATPFSTYYGGSGADVANAIAVDANGNMYVGGQTASTDFPLTGAIQSVNIGGSIGWVARIGVTAPPSQIPAVVSVSPTSGSGNTVTFTALYSHPAGATSITTAALLLNTSASTSFACYVTYDRNSNLFTLWNDTAAAGTTVIPGGGSAQNSQCGLNGPGTTATLNGTTLTLTVSITFRPGYTGLKTVHLLASDAATSTGFVSKGTWTATVPPPLASVDSVSPNADTGPRQTFTFTFSDTQDATNISTVAMLFKDTLTFTNACYMVYDRTAGTLALVWDNGLGSDSRPITSSTLLQNTQCGIQAATSQLSGLSLIVSITISFKSPFSGFHNIYMYAAEGTNNTGWVPKGTYTSSVGGAPTSDSVVPTSGTGSSQRFSFVVSDLGGSQFIKGISMLISPSLNTANACSIVYDRNVNTLALAFDTPGNGAAQVIMGSAAIVSNSQCSLRALNSTVINTAASVVVTVDILFNSSFSGPKNVYLFASEPTANSGFQPVGTWNVTGGAPTADSINPPSGAGTSASFVFNVSDSTSEQNISGVGALFTTGSPTNIANACYVVYNRTTTTVGLYNDAGTTLGTKGLGSSATLQNSQCAVAYSVAFFSGISVQVRIDLLFKSGFTGAKSVYLMAIEPATNSGWVSRGTWTVP